MHERITSIADIRTFLSEMVSSRPLPKWLFAMLDLFEQEDVPATYVYTRCRALGYVLLQTLNSRLLSCSAGRVRPVSPCT